MVNFIEGTSGDDTLIPGTNSDDHISGLAGNDLIRGYEGDDILISGPGNDTLFGGEGADYLTNGTGGTGTSFFSGGPGNDRFEVRTGGFADILGGDGDDDRFIHLDSAGTSQACLFRNVQEFANIVGEVWVGSTRLAAMTGVESLTVASGSGNDTVRSAHGDDFVDVQGGRNLVRTKEGSDNVTFWTGGRNTLDGGAGGNDFLFARHDLSGLTSGYAFTVTGDTATDSFGSSISGFERYHLTGGPAGDTLRSGGGVDLLTGNGGRDLLAAGGRYDALYGGGGRDTLYGGTGDDLLVGGTGADRLIGGGGSDKFRMERLDAADVIVDFDDADDLLQLTGWMMSGTLDPTQPAKLYDARVTGPEGVAWFPFLYDAADDVTRLWFDASGGDADDAILVARLLGQHALTEFNVDVL
jgi:Ca2+-binding RTX toxin-like protein